MVDPALEAELSSKSFAELETDLLMVVWHYFNEKLYSRPKDVIRRLDQMGFILSLMRKACEQGEVPPGDFEEKRTAHEARKLGWSLIWRANQIGQGQGNTPLLDRQTKKPSQFKKRPVTILDWVKQFLDLNAHPIHEALLKQDDLARILQWKVDLLLAFNAARKLFNAYKPRESGQDSETTHPRRQLGQEEARKLITEVMRLVWRRALPKDIEYEAQSALGRVLAGDESPLDAVIPLVQRLAKDKLGKSIPPDTVRQAAEYTRDKPPPSNGQKVEIIGERKQIIGSADTVQGAIETAKMAHRLWKNAQPGSQRKK